MDATTAYELMLWSPVFRREYPTEAALSEPIPTRSGWSSFVFVINLSAGTRVIRTPFAVGDVDARQNTVAFAKHSASDFGLTYPDRGVVQPEAAYRERFASLDERAERSKRYRTQVNVARDEWLGGGGTSAARSATEAALLAIWIPSLAPAYESLSPAFFAWLRGDVLA